MAETENREFERTLPAGGDTYTWYSLEAAETAGHGDFAHLPVSLKVLGENLLRNLASPTVSVDDVRALGAWADDPAAAREVAFHPTRILMPDISGIPLLVDLAAMRDAIAALGGDPAAVNPRLPVDLVVDHSVNVDFHGTPDALARNMDMEFKRNEERYRFIKWAQNAYTNIRVVPPGMGILHQVNLEFLGRVVVSETQGSEAYAYPDTMLGMDSHTTMINALSIFGWGVGGLEAGAAMLGQPVSMLIPEVVACRLTGALPAGATATDAVLTVTEKLRAHGVVGKFVEYCGPGLDHLALTDRATLSNMSPEYGATMGFFPVDALTLDYLRLTGRTPGQVELVETYAKAQGLWRTADEPVFGSIVEVDLGAVEPCLAGPFRPNQRTPLAQVPASYRDAVAERGRGGRTAEVADGYTLEDGAVVLAAITSCTNTSNPAVMLGAGLLARNAAARGLATKPWVKTSLSPGSAVVADYLAAAGLQEALDALGFNVVGFGCMSCGGLSGPLPTPVAEAVESHDLTVGAVLSGNRNFEGRVHPLCRVNYLASPMLVVAFALAGSVDRDLTAEPLGTGADGKPVYLKDVWPSPTEIDAAIAQTIGPDLYRTRYADAFEGEARWRGLPSSEGERFRWEDTSSYIRRPPLFEGMASEPGAVGDIRGARPLAMVGDMTTTDHISPVGSIPADAPAGEYLQSLGVIPADFNIYGTRRTNHEVMIRGTFANIRLRNELAPGTEGGFTTHRPSGEVMTIFDAATRYAAEGVPLVVVGGDAYGTGSSRDWAAKGTKLLGVRAVIAEGLERIHRSNLIGMGVLPLQFPEGTDRRTLGLDGTESFDILGLESGLRPRMSLRCRIMRADGAVDEIDLFCRLDTEVEVEYYRHGGMLQFCMREALAAA